MTLNPKLFELMHFFTRPAVWALCQVHLLTTRHDIMCVTSASVTEKFQNHFKRCKIKVERKLKWIEVGYLPSRCIHTWAPIARQWIYFLCEFVVSGVVLGRLDQSSHCPTSCSWSQWIQMDHRRLKDTKALPVTSQLGRLWWIDWILNYTTVRFIEKVRHGTRQGIEGMTK